MATKAPAHVRTSHRDRFLGLLPRNPDIPRVELHAAGALTPPKSASYYQHIPADGWGMLGNDDVGDCMVAGMYHTQQVWEKVARNVDTRFTTDEAIDDYSTITGYHKGKPSTDTGMTMQQGCDFWRHTGLGPHQMKIDAFADLDVGNTSLVKNCIALFGAVLIGMEVPASALDQEKAGKPWTVVSRRSTIEGGHLIPVFGYDHNFAYAVTWGRLQPISWGFYRYYFDEAVAPVSRDWLQTTGLTPSGLDGAAANADYQRLTHSSDSPFPVAA